MQRVDMEPFSPTAHLANVPHRINVCMPLRGFCNSDLRSWSIIYASPPHRVPPSYSFKFQDILFTLWKSLSNRLQTPEHFHQQVLRVKVHEHAVNTWGMAEVVCVPLPRPSPLPCHRLVRVFDHGCTAHYTWY